MLWTVGAVWPVLPRACTSPSPSPRLRRGAMPRLPFSGDVRGQAHSDRRIRRVARILLASNREIFCPLASVIGVAVADPARTRLPHRLHLRIFVESFSIYPALPGSGWLLCRVDRAEHVCDYYPIIIRNVHGYEHDVSFRRVLYSLGSKV